MSLNNKHPGRKNKRHVHNQLQYGFEYKAITRNATTKNEEELNMSSEKSRKREIINIKKQEQRNKSFNFSQPQKIIFLLTTWSRVLPEKLIFTQPVRNSPAFYAARRFIAAFTKARHLSLPSGRSNQSSPHPTS